MSGIIYHYTNSSGILGILNRKSDNIVLWFTHYKYLNDSSEGLELQRIYDHVIKEMNENDEMDEETYLQLKHVSFDDKNYYPYTNIENNETSTHIKHAEDDSYICCFSKNGDSLDMWRYYSKNDTGYAIGLFDYVLKKDTEIDGFSKNENRIGKCTWKDVIYDDVEKSRIVRYVILKRIDDIKRCGLTLVGNLSSMVKLDLMEYKFFFKHPCFQSEAEVRCVLSVPRNGDGFEGKTPFDISFRNSNGILTPYIELKFQKKALRSITVSPIARDEAMETIKDYLRNYKAEAIVKKSELPIRF